MGVAVGLGLLLATGVAGWATGVVGVALTSAGDTDAPVVATVTVDATGGSTVAAPGGAAGADEPFAGAAGAGDCAAVSAVATGLLDGAAAQPASASMSEQPISARCCKQLPYGKS